MQTFYPPLFGKYPSYKDSKLVVIALPWAATGFGGEGAENGPLISTICSSNMDFYSKELGDVLNKGIFLDEEGLDFIFSSSLCLRKKVKSFLKGQSNTPSCSPHSLLNTINQACQDMVKWVYDKCSNFYQDGKLVALLGGDHSVSEGHIKYLSEMCKGDLGILHIDAHADLRKHYQGFKHSHASIMYNVLHLKPPPKILVQLGIRDYCEEEYQRIKNTPSIRTFFDSDLKKAQFKGKNWHSITQNILSALPKKIYISLDVDGLDGPTFPHTGTPVPGGLNFEQIHYLLTCLALSKKHQIMGFDLVEISSPRPITKKLLSKRKKDLKIRTSYKKDSLKNRAHLKPHLHWTKTMDLQEIIAPLSLAEAQTSSFLLYQLCRAILFNQ